MTILHRATVGVMIVCACRTHGAHGIVWHPVALDFVRSVARLVGLNSFREGNEDWNAYRLGDALTFEFKNACLHYPDTLACAYQRATPRHSDIPILVRLLDERKG